MNTPLNNLIDPALRPPLPPRCGQMQEHEKFEWSLNNLMARSRLLRIAHAELKKQKKELTIRERKLSVIKKEITQQCKANNATLQMIKKERDKRNGFSTRISKVFTVWYRTQSSQSWVSSIKKPKPMFPVLAICGNQNKGYEVIRAVWIPRFYQEAINFTGDMELYNKKPYWPEGWYEWNREDPCHWEVDVPVAYWKPLPRPPDWNRMKQRKGKEYRDQKENTT
jgi:hypothetical protein